MVILSLAAGAPPEKESYVMKFCPECGTPYEGDPDDEGIYDCRHCGLWTDPVFWEIRNDLDYTTI